MSLLKFFSEPLQDSWLDSYGHLSDAYYAVAFTEAIWQLLAHFDIGREYFEATGGAMYTVENHVRYLKEVAAPASIDTESMILGSDSKRLHMGSVMKVDGVERATAEFMCLHFDSNSGGVVPMPPDVQNALKAAQVTKQPDWASSRISMEQR
ncbi:MAG: thioesterase [Rhodobacteraceae bacterium]|nr:thioesterase [Paracoccaceae bacterium]